MEVKKSSFFQWLISCLVLSLFDPLIVSAYIYLVMTCFYYYMSALFEEQQVDPSKSKYISFMSHTFHDRVYTALVFIGQNIFLYGVFQIWIGIAELYAKAIFSDDDYYKPYNSESLVLDGTRMLSMSISESYWLIVSWIKGLMNPVRIFSTFSWMISMACKKVMFILLWAVTILYVALMVRSLFGIPYSFMPSEDSVIYGTAYSYISHLWDFQNPLLKRIFNMF